MYHLIKSSQSFDCSPPQHFVGPPAVAEENAFLDTLSGLTAVGGTHKQGFFSKKFDARSITLTGSQGMIG